MRVPTASAVLLAGVWSGLFLLLWMPFVVTTGTVFPHVVGKALYARALIEIVTGLWLALLVLRPGYRLLAPGFWAPSPSISPWPSSPPPRVRASATASGPTTSA